MEHIYDFDDLLLFSKAEKTFSEKVIRQVYDKLKPKVDFAIFKKGFKVETEHAKTVHNDANTIGKIVLDHLKEYADYYDRLEKVET